jgi:hypothetical protein
MITDNFKDWLESLDTQTLTDELKDTIHDYALSIYEDARAEGYQQAKEDALEQISNM